MCVYIYIDVFHWLDENVSALLSIHHLIHRPSLSIHSTNIYFILVFGIFFRQERKEEGGEKERDRQRHQFVAPLIYALTGWFLYVSWPEVEPATLAYQDNTLTNWPTQPGLNKHLLSLYYVPRPVLKAGVQL